MWRTSAPQLKRQPLGSRSLILVLAAVTTFLGCVPDSAATARAFETARTLGRSEWLPDSSLEWLPTPSAATPRLLAHVHWEGPSASALVLMTCDGRVVSSNKSGGIDSTKIIGIAPLADSALLIYYQSGHGTGWLQHSAAIVSVAHDSLAVLLDLVTEEMSNAPAANGYHEDSTSIRWQAPGTLVRRGVKYTLRCGEDGNCSRRRGVRIHETYSWNARLGRFIRLAPRG